MGLSSSVNFGLVFIEGFVSFFSPCVIPLIPLYMGYLAGGTSEKDENGNTLYKKKNIFLHTLFFILGVSAAFFILGLGFSSLGSLLKDYRDIISKVGGIIIIILGLNQLGVFKLNFLNKQLKLNNKVNTKKMNPIVAFVMGFGFSFAWTPCVGPALASVLILASNAKSVLEGNLLVGVYMIGFLIPFLILGIFTGETLNFIKKNPKIMEVVVKVGAVVLIIMGLILATGTLDKIEGKINNITSTQNSNSTSTDNSQVANSGENSSDNAKSEDKNTSSSDKSKSENTKTDKGKNSTTSTDSKEDANKNESDKSNSQSHMMVPIKLEDQFGNEVDLTKQKGKTLFVNFFATWCPPCRHEIPDIEKLYQNTGKNQKDVFVVGIVSTGDGRQNEAGVKEFIKKNNINYPVLFDKNNSVFDTYGVYSLPTTFFVKKNQEIKGYVPGGISYEIMEKLLKETMEN